MLSDCVNITRLRLTKQCVLTLDADHGLRAHRGKNLSHQSEVGSVVQSQRRYSSREGSAVEKSEMLLGGEDEGLQAVFSISFTAGDNLARASLGTIPNANEWVTNQGASDVR